MQARGKAWEPRLGGVELVGEGRHLGELVRAAEMETLEQIGLIAPTSDDPPRYLPTRAVNDCTLVEIWRALRKQHAHALQENANSPDLKAIQAFEEELDAIVTRELGKRTFIEAIK